MIIAKYVLETLTTLNIYFYFHFDYLKLRQPGYVCRDSYNECDLPEICTGESGQCPTDVYKKNGSPCGVGPSGMEKATGEFLNKVKSKL